MKATRRRLPCLANEMKVSSCRDCVVCTLILINSYEGCKSRAFHSSLNAFRIDGGFSRYGGYTNGGKFNIKSNKCIQKKKRFLVRGAEESD